MSSMIALRLMDGKRSAAFNMRRYSSSTWAGLAPPLMLPLPLLPPLLLLLPTPSCWASCSPAPPAAPAAANSRRHLLSLGGLPRCLKLLLPRVALLECLHLYSRQMSAWHTEACQSRPLLATPVSNCFKKLLQRKWRAGCLAPSSRQGDTAARSRTLLALGPVPIVVPKTLLRRSRARRAVSTYTLASTWRVASAFSPSELPPTVAALPAPRRQLALQTFAPPARCMA